MRALVTLFLALVFVGSAFAGEREAAIEKRMRQRYDFTALSVFLKKVVSEHPSFEGVSLASTKIGPDEEYPWAKERPKRPVRDLIALIVVATVVGTLMLIFGLGIHEMVSWWR